MLDRNDLLRLADDLAARAATASGRCPAPPDPAPPGPRTDGLTGTYTTGVRDSLPQPETVYREAVDRPRRSDA